MTGFLVEFRRTPLRWAALPLFAAAAAMIFFVGDPWQGSWPETSAASTRAAVPLMIAGVGLAAQQSSRLRRSGSDLLLTARPLPQVELARLAADAAWLCLVYVLCTACAWITAAGAPGGPWLDYPLFGLSGIIFALALGHFIGRIAPTRFTGAIAAIGGFLLFSLVFSSNSSPLAYIAFYHSIDVRISSAHLAWRLAITVLALAAACTVGWVLESSGRRKSTSITGVFFSAATLIAIGAMPGNGSLLLEGRQAEEPVCAPSGESSVCVWPEHADRLPEAVEAARKVAQAAEGVLSPPARYMEQGLGEGGTGGFTLDHGPRDLLHTVLIEMTDSHKNWCEEESEKKMQIRVDAGLRLEAWLEARATRSTQLPSYEYSGDTSWQQDVLKVMKLPDSQQVEFATQWAKEMRTPC
ncbi:DUF7224 domain-containing protein [Streptomyces viridosporus]|uniref:DUF7224 domain-containing protein n=1 Tax=Streptomyces viridosporus T7A TaxID=665577 RepID=A0ABX6ACT1_STRVD|nr:hypothetical protein [Streptomyces viridosporus]QEU85602.1 hypothetical protein CP969_13400 [Streptomyces viridosporus T7A]